MSSRYTVDQAGGTYFLTSTVVEWIDLFTRDCYRRIVLDSLAFCIREKQVFNDLSSVITDTVNWVKVSGQFVAQGGEKFLTIGNFLPNALTTLENNVLEYNVAYYYIDDVTVSKCSTFGTSINGLVENEKQLLSVYPNPASDIVELKFDFKPGFQYNVEIHDLSGRLIFREAVSINSRKIDVSTLDVGFYTVRIGGKDGLVEAAKLAVVR